MKSEYLTQQPASSENEDQASKQASKILPIVEFNVEFSPTISHYRGEFFMSISYRIDGADCHQRVPLDTIQVAHLVAQGAKSLAAHVSYDLAGGVGS